MIGGYDMALDGPWSTRDVEHLLRALLDLWPAAWVESSDTVVADGRPLADGVLWAAGRGGLLVYRDEAAVAAWTARGWTEEYGDALVYLTVAPDEVTAVVGSEDCAAAECLRNMFAVLRGRWEVAT